MIRRRLQNIVKAKGGPSLWLEKLASLAVIALFAWTISGWRATAIVLPALIVLIISFFWGRKRRVRAHRLAIGQCVNCGYSLYCNETMICPECGEPYEKLGRMRLVQIAPRR